MLGLLFLGILTFPSLGAPSLSAYTAALANLNWTAVDIAINNVLNTSNASFWPADYGYYGPLMIRLAWHCAGSYRKFDGRGGCDGGRIRFSPEGSWDDNANLDKARALLEPVKAQFGDGLSYGDLYIRAGTLAIYKMGGPVLGFCAGRFDNVDGNESLLLGPNTEQNTTFPCAVQGDCQAMEGLGPTTLGLIYVNPGGPMGNGNPNESAPQIRDSFGRMDMNDRETVALIGGGHSFGKSHGACVGGGGSAPNWVGTCNVSGGNGKGLDAHTSGFEGPWTSTPTTWGNLYFTGLKNGNWTPFTGAGGQPQFHDLNGPTAPQVDGVGTVPIAMLVADISLTTDTEYNALVNEYAASAANLSNDFKAAWYKLVTRDMGPSKRCFSGGDAPFAVPPSQDWQYDLPAPTVATLPDYAAVKTSIRALPGYGPVFAQLAWQCASTYRQTDFRGGCNGARIRFAPENMTAANVALNSSGLISVLAGLRTTYPTLSYADAIVLAGHVAVEDALGTQIDFCGGRTDATDGTGSANLEPLNWTNVAAEFREKAARMGLTLEELVVLQAVPRPGVNSTLSTAFFEWIVGNETTTNRYDLAIRGDAGLKAIAQMFANNPAKIAEVFPLAWNKVMNADFFIGWNNLTCPKALLASAPAYSSASSILVGLTSIVAWLAVA